MRHATEFGIGFCAQLNVVDGSCPRCAVLRDEALINLAVPRGVGASVLSLAR